MRVAALAQHRAAHRQHARLVRSVRVVAIAAIFGDRCVLPKIRSALFGVAVKAGVVQRLLYELQIVGRAMIAVTAAAIHFALAYRVGVRF